MPSGSVQLQGVVNGLPTGRLDLVTELILAAAAIGTVNLVNLSSGNNTITPPTGVTTIIVIPPIGNTTNIFLKGVAGDTGVQLHDTRWNCFHLDAAQTTFVLNAAAGINNVSITYI